MLMLAARFNGTDAPFIVEDIDVPTIGRDEVLVDVQAASICGSDLLYHEGTFPVKDLPRTIGHEGSGIICEAGKNVKHIGRNDHVVIHYPASCGDCRWCLKGMDNRCRHRVNIGIDRDGTFAEYIAIPANNAVKMDKQIPFDWGSITGCAVSTAFHAVKRSKVESGETVVVFGIGGVGLHTVKWIDYHGVQRIIAVDLVDEKLEAALEYGADVVINANRRDVLDIISAETDGYGADTVIECSGATEAMNLALECVTGKSPFESGTIVAVGVQNESITIEQGAFKEGRFLVSNDHTRHDLLKILQILEKDNIDLSQSIFDTITLSDFTEGIQLVRNHENIVGRIVVDCSLD